MISTPPFDIDHRKILVFCENHKLIYFSDTVEQHVDSRQNLFFFNVNHARVKQLLFIMSFSKSFN